MDIIRYARVSTEFQDAGDKVSIDEQLADMQALCERNGWHVVGTFIDREKYKATQYPNKGKVVNPSGERADRPEFLKMLELIRTGDIDAILCWRDDRLVRHPRVNVALEDAMEQGDRERKGKDDIAIIDATGAKLDRFTMSIKASVWREENKRKSERIKMGKIGTLKAGGWPGQYNRLGYTTRRENGKRGRVIEIEPTEEQTVKNIFVWYDAGLTLKEIKQQLITQGAEQKGHPARRRRWSKAILNELLRAKDYTGVATWQWANGTQYTIEIPQIIPLTLWQRVQARIDQNKSLSTRKAKGVYLLQGLLYCGECGSKVSPRAARYFYKIMADGTRKRYQHQSTVFSYRCNIGTTYDDPHPTPKGWGGAGLDWEIWRFIVDNGIKRPEAIHEQVLNRQANLKTQGENVTGDIAHANRKLAEIDQERARYQRAWGKGKINDSEFDARMEETEEARAYWSGELHRLQELRDNQAKVQAGLDYATELMTTLQKRLPEIDQDQETLKAMPEEKRRGVLKQRQRIIRALCDKVLVYADGRVKIEGVLDGSEAAQFELGNLWIDLHKLYYSWQMDLANLVDRL